MEPNPAEKVVWPSVHVTTILVPTDLRTDSKVALSFALALAQKFEANLILLHVFSETYSSDAEVDLGAARLLDITREDAEREVARLEQQLRDHYSKCRSTFRIGSPFEQILREAVDLKASRGYKRRAAIRPNKKTPASADEFPFLLLALALSEFSRSTAQCFPSLRGRKRPVLPVWGNSPAVQ